MYVILCGDRDIYFDHITLAFGDESISSENGDRMGWPPAKDRKHRTLTCRHFEFNEESMAAWLA